MASKENGGASPLPTEPSQPQTNWMASNGLWNLPNILSMARVVLIPILAAVLYSPLPERGFIAFLIFLVASVTDFVDGYLARKWKIESPFGAFLDPVADKLMVSTTLVILCKLHASPPAAAAAAA
eukprot:CAMPEP_0113665688 /NCGR_PEP_ID=MMETSP0038_2-20120614/2441_1 /TAXON_ID=2898 /ORGANISM="Cryptomonas paramecium" /LENGTH=124 /DNA_ID=CAMNT_0000581063 /DNA_START=193 /DNA_END=563 /DNA_ORIENTATION=- /assembly_acc=CAM_ASM_000170